MTQADVKRARYQTDPEFRARTLEHNRESKRRNAAQASEYRRAYVARNPEREAARKRAHKEANPERYREYTRKYSQTDAGRVAGMEARSRFRAANPEYVRETQRAYLADRDRAVNPKAVNRRAPWSEAEIRIALDPNLSVAEAALMLGRTVRGVSQRRFKSRRAAA